MTDTLGLLLVVMVTAASLQDTTGGRMLMDVLASDHPSVTKAWVDAGYKRSVIDRGAQYGIDVEVVSRLKGQKGFQPLPKRWAVERTLYLGGSPSIVDLSEITRLSQKHPFR